MSDLQLRKIILAVFAATVTTSAWAGEAELESRITQLEETLKAMQQQRAEQDKQLEILTKELVGIENQMTQKSVKASEEKKSTATVQTEDGFGFKSADGKNEIKLQGRVQADYHAFQGAGAQLANTTEVRRAYLTLAGKVYNDYDFKVTGNFADQKADTSIKTTVLDEAYFGINWWKQAKFRFGQFQMPFGLETSTSDLFNDFAERSMANALAPFKERGGMVHGNPINGVYYGLALSTGRGKNANNTDTSNDNPEVVGRGVVNLAKFFNLNNSVVHVGGSFSHGYISPNQAFSINTASANSFLVGQGIVSTSTEGRGLTFFTPGSLNIAAGNELERTRLGAEAAYSYGPLKLQAEYFTHNYQGTSGTLSNGSYQFDKDINAWYVSANWLVTGEVYADSYLAENGTWGRIKPRNSVDFSNGHYGAVVLGLRYSDYDASDFKYGSGAGAVLTGASTGAHAVTGAVTWIMNPNTRLAVNYVDTRFENGGVATSSSNGNLSEGTAAGEKAITLRGQFDF